MGKAQERDIVTNPNLLCLSLGLVRQILSFAGLGHVPVPSAANSEQSENQRQRGAP